MDKALHLVDRRFLRFALVGGSNFVIGLLLFQAAWLLGEFLGPWRTPAAQAFAYAIGMVWSFLWNRSWVFQPASGQSAVGGEAFRFAAAQILCLVVSTLLVTLAIDGVGLPPLLGWVTAMVPMIFFNFLLISRWVFPTRKANTLQSMKRGPHDTHA